MVESTIHCFHMLIQFCDNTLSGFVPFPGKSVSYLITCEGLTSMKDSGLRRVMLLLPPHSVNVNKTQKEN